MLQDKSLLIVEEALQTLEIGHWYEHIKTIATNCRFRGVKVTIAAHQKATPDLLQDLQALPAMSHSAWEPQPSQNFLGRSLSTLRHNLYVYRDVKCLLQKSTVPYDCVFAPTVQINQLIGWYLLVRRFGGKKFRRCVLFFLNPPGHYTGPNTVVFPKSAALMRQTLRQFKPYIDSGMVTFGVETVRTSEHFKLFCGLSFEVIPQPVSLQSFPRVKEESTVTLGCYGFARYEKGSDILQSALVLLFKKFPDFPARFLIQWRNDFLDADGRKVSKDPALIRNAAVEFIDRAFGTGEYSNYLSITDGVILPYRKSSYYDRDSRVAIEAAVLGIPTIYTRGTWLEQAANYFGTGVGFDDENAEDLERAIREFVLNIRSHRAQAMQSMPRAREYFSSDRFREWLLLEREKPAAKADWIVF